MTSSRQPEPLGYFYLFIRFGFQILNCLHYFTRLHVSASSASQSSPVSLNSLSRVFVSLNSLCSLLTCYDCSCEFCPGVHLGNSYWRMTLWWMGGLWHTVTGPSYLWFGLRPGHTDFHWLCIWYEILGSFYGGRAWFLVCLCIFVFVFFSVVSQAWLNSLNQTWGVGSNAFGCSVVILIKGMGIIPIQG